MVWVDMRDCSQVKIQVPAIHQNKTNNKQISHNHNPYISANGLSTTVPIGLTVNREKILHIENTLDMVKISYDIKPTFHKNRFHNNNNNNNNNNSNNNNNNPIWVVQNLSG